MTQPDLSGLTNYLQDHGIGVVVLLILAFIAFRAVRPDRPSGAHPPARREGNRPGARGHQRRRGRQAGGDARGPAVDRPPVHDHPGDDPGHPDLADLLPVIAGLGVIIAAITLAGQSIVLDYLMGILIVLEGPYYKGDWIMVGTVEGTVEEVGLRRTTLRDNAGTFHSVSNGEIRIASNLTRVYARMQVDMIVAFGTDLDLATGSSTRSGRRCTTIPTGRTACSRSRRLTRLRRSATWGSRSGSPARSARPIAGRRRASSAAASSMAFQANGIEIPRAARCRHRPRRRPAPTRPGPRATRRRRTLPGCSRPPRPARRAGRPRRMADRRQQEVDT